MKSILIPFLFCVLIPGKSYCQETISNNNLKKPDGISVDGVPPLSADLRKGVIPYRISRFAYLQDLHPLKKELLIHTQLGNTIQAYIVSMPGGMRRQVTFYDEPLNASLFDPQKGEFIIVQRDNNGDEFYQLYRHDLRTGSDVLLTDGGKSYNFNPVWNNKGNKLYYTSLTNSEATSNIYVVNPNDPASNHLISSLEGPNWSIQRISTDESKIILTVPENGSNTAKSLWIYDSKTKTNKQLLSAKNSGYVIGFTKDNNGIFMNSGQLKFYNLTNQKFEQLTDLPWGIRGAFLSPDGSKIAFTTNEAGNTKAYVFFTDKKKYEAIKNLPVGFVSGMKWWNDNQSLFFQFSTSYANSDIYEWNCNTRKIIPWVVNETVGTDRSLIPAPQLIKWKSFDSLEISGFLYPASKKFHGKRPVIIDIHGGPVMQALPLYNSNTNYYTNELGVTVIFPNIRGSAGFGPGFTELDNGMKKENAVKDIGALLDWIAKQPGLDTSRVMVTGGSYGGYMTYRTAIEYNSRIRCAIEAFGISDLFSYKKSIDNAYREFFAQEFGDDSDRVIRDYFNRISPLRNANKITMPIFIVQGKNDPRIPYTESQQMVDAIKKNGGTVWYLLANDEGHGFYKQANEDYLFYASVEFIRKYLLN